MHAFLELLEQYFVYFVKIGYHLIEIAGILVILISVIKGFIGYFKKDPKVKFELGKGIMLGIELMIGAEIMHSAIATSLMDLALLGAIIAVRIILTFVLHWEVSEEEKEEKEEKKAEKAELSEKNGK